MNSGVGSTIQTRKKSVLLAQLIVDEIVTSGLSEGDRLAPEAEMCEVYGVGRSTIREALRVLENQGVITIKTGPGGGPVVSAFNAGFLAANIALHLQLSGATFRDVMNARLVIEPRIAAAAAREGRGDAMRELHDAVDSGRDSTVGRDHLVAQSAHFHDLVAASSDNPFFQYLLLALHRITEPFAKRLTYEGERRARLVQHHQDILDAIEARDPAAAEEAMRIDLLEFVDYVDSEAPRLFDEPIQWADVRP